MVRLKILSGKDVCEILSDHGFKQIRQKGSHVIMQKKIHGSTKTVLVPYHKEIKVELKDLAFKNQLRGMLKTSENKERG